MARRAVVLFLVGMAAWLAIPVAASAESYDATVEALDNAFAQQIVRIQPGERSEERRVGKECRL